MHMRYIIGSLIGATSLVTVLGATNTTEVVTGDHGPEANLPFLFAAFAVAWLGFMIYAWYLASQHAHLRQEIANMQSQLTDIQNSVNNQ